MKYNFFDDIPTDEYTIDIMTIDPADKDVFKEKEECDVYITCKTARDLIARIKTDLFITYKKYSLIIHTLEKLKKKITDLLETTGDGNKEFFNYSPKKQNSLRESIQKFRNKNAVQNYKDSIISDMTKLVDDKNIISQLIEKFKVLDRYHKKTINTKKINIYSDDNSEKCVVNKNPYFVSGFSISVKKKNEEEKEKEKKKNIYIDKKNEADTDNDSYTYTLYYKPDNKSSTAETPISLTKLCIVKNIDDIPNIHNINNIDNRCITQEKPKDASTYTVYKTPEHSNTDPKLTQDIRRLELEFNNEQIKLKNQLSDSITTELSILSHMSIAWNSSKQQNRQYYIDNITAMINLKLGKQQNIQVSINDLERKNKTLQAEIDNPIPEEKSAAKPAGPPADPPASSSVALTADKSVASPTGPSADKSVALTASSSVALTVDKSVASPTGPPADKSVASPADKSVASPADKSVASPTAKPESTISSPPLQLTTKSTGSLVIQPTYRYPPLSTIKEVHSLPNKYVRRRLSIKRANDGQLRQIEIDGSLTDKSPKRAK